MIPRMLKMQMISQENKKHKHDTPIHRHVTEEVFWSFKRHYNNLTCLPNKCQVPKYTASVINSTAKLQSCVPGYHFFPGAQRFSKLVPKCFIVYFVSGRFYQNSVFEEIAGQNHLSDINILSNFFLSEAKSKRAKKILSNFLHF